MAYLLEYRSPPLPFPFTQSAMVFACSRLAPAAFPPPRNRRWSQKNKRRDGAPGAGRSSGDDDSGDDDFGGQSDEEDDDEGGDALLRDSTALKGVGGGGVLEPGYLNIVRRVSPVKRKLSCSSKAQQFYPIWATSLYPE